MTSAPGSRPATTATAGHDPVPIVGTLPPGPRERLARLVERRTLEPGATVMHEGDVTRSMSIIVRGRVALRLRVPERGPVTILTLEAGEIVGWSALVPPFRATTSATALEATELATMDAEALRELLASDDEVAAKFLPAVMESIAARVAATRDQLLDLFRGSQGEPW